MVAVGAVTVVAAGWGAIAMLRQRSLEGFAVVTFLLLCLPYLHLVPYSPPSLVSDRFLSLAVWPATLLLVALAWRLKPVPRIALLLVVTLSWGFQTLERPRDWRNFETVINTDMRAYPGYYMPVFFKVIALQLPQGQYRDAFEIANKLTDPEYRNIMLMMIEASYAVHIKAGSTGNPQEAMGRLWKWGVKLNQPPASAKWNLPVNLLWQKSQGVLKDEWEYLAAHFPDNESVHYNFSLWLVSENMYLDAAPHLRAATESKRLPESVRGTAYKNLGLALLYTGHAAEAEIPLRAALEQAPPDMKAHCLLAVVYEKTKRLEEAARAATDCAKFSPGGN